MIYFLKKYRRGIKNRYRKGMPLTEMIIKDLGYIIRELVNYFINHFRDRTILIYPHLPSSGSTMYKVAKILRYNITNKKDRKFDLAVYWEYLTNRLEYQYLESLAHKIRIINLHSRDISKVFVDKKFHEAFLYSSIINPLEYMGTCVKKNDINARHDGVIINCPIDKTEKGYIYQVLIDNSYNHDLVRDIRVPVVDSVLDFVYLKYRKITERFKNTTEYVEVVDIKEVLSDKEIGNLNNFCKLINLEYGELDVLRDNKNKHIYVVDVNNTPQGPPKNISKKAGKQALNKIATAFAEKYLML
ncbi:MAG: hypothetical protein R6W78_07570 [Bacteroidales bacterium]